MGSEVDIGLEALCMGMPEFLSQTLAWNRKRGEIPNRGSEGTAYAMSRDSKRGPAVKEEEKSEQEKEEEEQKWFCTARSI